MAVLERPKPGPRHPLKRVLVGRPHPTSHLEHTLLPKILALPIFSSDPLSSVAYATEQIMVVLLAGSLGATHLVIPISLAIAALMAIVVTSYRQTVRAYPNGGGSYIVSKDNLGTTPALVAAAALLVDYVLTVSVSVVAGVVAIVGAASGLAHYTVELSIGFVVLLTLANLRGVRESGALFAFPTYAFVVSILAMVGVGIVECARGGCPSAAAQHVQPIANFAKTAGPIGLFVLLHAFSSGSTALTGVEAISNGVPAFKRPQSRNAATTLAAMGGIAIVMFMGTSFLATHIHGVVPPGSGQRSVVGQIAFSVFHGGFGFYAVQVFTAAILVLAANTSFQDFPRLSAILARDRYMPRQFVNRGDRLVFSNGVVVLAALAAGLIWAFNANLDKLIQLYVVGVFTAFTLSQAGMVVHWRKLRRAEGPRVGRVPIVINSIGAICTGVVLVIIASTKFLEGAWISILAMALIVLLFRRIHLHYAAVATQLRQRAVSARVPENRVVLLVDDVTDATAEALGYVRSIVPAEVRALSLTPGGPSDDDRSAWSDLTNDSIDLDALPGGHVIDEVQQYLRAMRRDSGDFVTALVPEAIEGGLLRYVAGHRDLIRLKARLLRERRIAVADAPVIGAHEPANAWIPGRTVALVFVSGVHDAAVRAANYARSLHALETRAVYFALDHGAVDKIVEQWFDRRPGMPLDIVDAPYRDLAAPMLSEVRRYTNRADTLVSLVIPELLPRRPLHRLLHRQTALFVKRLFLFEPRVVLTSVPYHLD